MPRTLRARIDTAYTTLIPRGCCATCGLSKDIPREMYFLCPSNRNVAEYVSDRPDVDRCADCGKFPFLAIWRTPTRPKANQIAPIEHQASQDYL